MLFSGKQNIICVVTLPVFKKWFAWSVCWMFTWMTRTVSSIEVFLGKFPFHWIHGLNLIVNRLGYIYLDKFFCQEALKIFVRYFPVDQELVLAHWNNQLRCTHWKSVCIWKQYISKLTSWKVNYLRKILIEFHWKIDSNRNNLKTT